MKSVIKDCRLCGSTGPHQIHGVREMMFGTRQQFEYYSCASCYTLRIVNVLEGEELMRHYPPNYYSYDVSTDVSTLQKLFQWLIAQQDRFRLHTGGRLFGALTTAPFLEGIVRVAAGGDVVRMIAQLSLEHDARILDVGCGGGALLDRLALVGFNNMFGVDPFITADGESPRGVPLMKRYLSEVTDEFDLIMFNHSLEHVPDPVATLKVASEKLAAGGICLVRLPTTSSEAWTAYRTDWVQIDAPRHVVIPSRQEWHWQRIGLG